jgi:glycosyltransferase involved in cell wall biosynthesis
VNVWAIVALVFAAFPALMYFRNVKLFRRPGSLPSPPAGEGLGVRGISVLIPARNEEAGIAMAVSCAVANMGVELEVIVLDDSSTDRTAERVRELAALDSRVRLETAPPLPPGWCGKQHACYTLSKLARYEILTFLDADVRLEPHALANMVGFLDSSGAALVSGFPRQETETFLEQLVIPLIHWLLLCYLPLHVMRKSLQPGLGAGCGQWFLTTKAAYEKVGGHGHPLVKESLHDGIKLPRAYRKCGLMTDVCDATADATCRMYRSAGQVWNGFAKNAREGLGAPGLIWVWTVLLVCGHVLPFVLLGFVWWIEGWAKWAVFAAAVLSWLPRFHAVTRFDLPMFTAWLHPVGVLLMLAIQWYATVRTWVGRPVGWKGRAHPSQELASRAA